MTSSILEKPYAYSSSSSCSIRLSTIVNKINSVVPNQENAYIISSFHKYLHEKGSSENHQVNCLKVVIEFGKHLGPVCFNQISEKVQILSFLNKKVKNLEEDPDKRWITTWNHYLNRIKLFLRWLFNYYLKKEHTLEDDEDWITPNFCKIKMKQTKRVSPYLESEIWERSELVSLLNYEPNLRNKVILSLMWDLNARPHEITLLRIKNLRLKDKYGEGEVPYQAKTGTGPVLLMMSFPYVRDWLNQHPFRNESNACVICNLHNGAPIKPKTIWNIMNQLRKRIVRMLESNEITAVGERQKLEFFIKTKKFNPYCIRHSSISADSDHLPEYALKKKVRWSMNSRQGNRYIKRRMGMDLKQKILNYNGIEIGEKLQEERPVHVCPRCDLVNAVGNRYCSVCAYPLVPSAYDEIKESEELRMKKMESQIEFLLQTQNEILECQKYPAKLSQIAQE